MLSLKELMKEVKVIEVDAIPGLADKDLFPEKLEQANKILKGLKLPTS